MDLLKPNVYLAYVIIYSAILIVVAMAIVAKKSKVPGRMQNALEIVSDFLRNTFMSALGPGGERHLWLVYSLFWYILFCNLIELFPIFKAVTANPSNTIGMGLIVFVYSQYIGIKSKGLKNYLKHFLGPSLFLVVLLAPIEILGELIKPFTLGMRLFGNIYAEDVMKDLAAKADVHYFIPLLQIPVMGLQVFTGLIQAYIFALLACAYIGLMAEHHDDGHGDDLAPAHS